MKKVSFIIGALIVILIAIAVSQNYLKERNTFQKIPTATIDKRIFKLYIAKSSKEKEIGLSKYNNLPQDYGMLFPFERSDYYSFWMKDMKFPIDIIFIRKNRIVTIYSNISPPKTKNESLIIFKPKTAADTVLEINAELSKKYNFKNGDGVEIKNVF